MTPPKRRPPTCHDQCHGLTDLHFDAEASFTYNAERVLGSGSFGVVYQAQAGTDQSW